MYVQVLEQENRVAEAKSNGLGIRVTCSFYPLGAFHKNTRSGSEMFIKYIKKLIYIYLKYHKYKSTCKRHYEFNKRYITLKL